MLGLLSYRQRKKEYYRIKRRQEFKKYANVKSIELRKDQLGRNKNVGTVTFTKKNNRKGGERNR